MISLSDIRRARILVVDDEPAMIDSYRRSFAPTRDGYGAELDAMAAELFGEDAAEAQEPAPIFALTYETQGLDAVAEVERALAAGDMLALY